MSKKNILLKIILPLLVLAVGIAGALFITRMQKPPVRKPPMESGLLVDVMQVENRSHQVNVHATGTVHPSMEISLVPEVSGKVTWLSPQMISGGFLRQGEKLLEIDKRDYLLAVNRAKAELARAEVALQTEQQKASIALQEWQRLDLPDKGEPNPLVLHEPQLQQEQANLAAAEASLEQAELNLKRTALYAPFNCRVRTEQVDPGQYVRAANTIATLTGTDRVEINVPLPIAELQWLTIPRAGQKLRGSAAIITLETGKTTYRWEGEIVRSLGEIDTNSHMATVVVAVDDPYHRRQKEDTEQIDLAVGLFVDITLQGKTVPNVVPIPRETLREDSSVWLVDSKDRLQIHPVHILRREKELLLIDDGLSGGERLVLTTLTGAANGLQLRIESQESAQ